MWSWQSCIVVLTFVISTLSLPQHYYTDVDYERAKTAYIRQLEADVERAARSGAAVEALQLEDRLEDSILEQARESLAKDSGDPARAARDLENIQQEWRRDKRAVDFLSGLLGSSSGSSSGGDHSSGGGGGSGSGSILNLVGPLLGSSSGGSSGGGGGGEGEAAAGGSDSGSILSLVGPLLGSSSGGGGGDSDAEGGSAGGSDSGSILNLVGPLLGSSSGGGGSGGEGGDAGSGSASILNLVGPLLGSSSGSSGGGGGDGSSGGGGSDLSSILGLSNSSGGSSGGGTEDAHAGGDAGIGGAVNAFKFGFLQDKIQLLLRVKFGIFTKLLNSLSGALAAVSSPQHVPINELKYPDP